ncbi:MAG: site-2 protease family protein [Scytolyngbya sp. HA4215-MV1]|jgi:Zn-dependent protease/CBS domain-containing protein|nr:site-2 protease family protein [Scytolyngbya sp. HA4215-MV1]
MNGNIRVGNLFGIPFYINPSWFVVLALVTWVYGTQFSAAGAPWLWGLATALLLFASVLAHELGHSFVALSQGIRVHSITLFLFGGIASLEKESKTPAGAFWVAIAGPLVSIFLFLLFTAIRISLPWSGALAVVLGVLAYVNLALALFNLIPGLPLDGGNILKALVWKVTGNPNKGIVFAGRVGQIFGWVAIASGLVPLLLTGNSSNLWNALIGLFLLQNAGRAAQYATVQEQFTGLTAADAVLPNGPIVSANLSLRAFADQRILSADNWRKFLVTDDAGRLLGEVAIDALQTIPVERWSEMQMGELVQPIEQSRIVPSSQPLLEVVKLLEEKQISALTVIRENGILVGLLEKPAILELLQNRAKTTPA